jgi:hypothetical protein
MFGDFENPTIDLSVYKDKTSEQSTRLEGGDYFFINRAFQTG